MNASAASSAACAVLAKPNVAAATNAKTEKVRRDKKRGMISNSKRFNSSLTRH
jgi:hypothetical protein